MMSSTLGNSLSKTTSSGNKTPTARCAHFAGSIPTARIGFDINTSSKTCLQVRPLRRHQVISVCRIALLSPGAAIGVEAAASIQKPWDEPWHDVTSPSASIVGSRMSLPNAHDDRLLAQLDNSIGSPSMIFTLSTD